MSEQAGPFHRGTLNMINFVFLLFKKKQKYCPTWHYDPISFHTQLVFESMYLNCQLPQLIQHRPRMWVTACKKDGTVSESTLSFRFSKEREFHKVYSKLT